MALVVEDGTGLSTADAYVSLADCATYHVKMGNTWTGTDTAKESAIRKATQYIDTRYLFRGVPVNADQALAFPREGVDWPTKRIVDACCELALRALTESLYADLDASIVKREKVGPLEVEYQSTINGGQKRYSLIDDLLSLYMLGGRGQSVVVRA